MYSVPNPKSRNYKRDKETKSQDCAFRAKFQNNISLKNFRTFNIILKWKKKNHSIDILTHVHRYLTNGNTEKRKQQCIHCNQSRGHGLGEWSRYRMDGRTTVVFRGNKAGRQAWGHCRRRLRPPRLWILHPRPSNYGPCSPLNAFWLREGTMSHLDTSPFHLGHRFIAQLDVCQWLPTWVACE